VAALLDAAGVTGDVELLTESLLAYLDTVLITYLHTRRRMPAPRIAGGWTELVDRMVGPDRSG